MLTPFLLACALAVGQSRSSDAGEWLLIPVLGRGQELVYRGSYSEERLDGGVQFNRAYRLETRVFILDLVGREAHVAFYTELQPRPARSETGGNPEPTSVRLEMATVGAFGKVTPNEGMSLLVPLEGPPTIENGVFVEVPPYNLRVNSAWEVAEPGRQPRSWRVEGTEQVNGTLCVKMIGVQQSPDWDRPRADSTAWRRRDVVWMGARTGYAYRIERTIERRDPARSEPGHRSVTRYDLENSLQYPGKLWEDRRREILLARSIEQSLRPLLPRAGEVGPKPFEAALAKISYHMDYQPPTPYRAVLKQLRSRAEAGKRGESPPAAASEEAEPIIPTLTMNRPAPDFVVPDFTSPGESARLKRFVGKPILMVFYHPTALTGSHMLQFGQVVQSYYRGQVTVLGMACTEDQAMVTRQRQQLGLTFPILCGSGLRLTYEVKTTPKLVVLDAEGIVRATHVGWGIETPELIHQELRRCLPEPRQTPE